MADLLDASHDSGRETRLPQLDAAAARPASPGRSRSASITRPRRRGDRREVLAHLAEMLPYWLGEIERVVDA